MVVKKSEAEKSVNELVRTLGVTRAEAVAVYDPAAEALETLLQMMLAAKLSLLSPEEIQARGENAKNELIADLLRDPALSGFVENLQGSIQSDSEGNFNINRGVLYNLLTDRKFEDAVKSSA